MSSSGKTPYLSLNQWVGTDKPLRVDFNRDNQTLDLYFEEHDTDAERHITARERENWNSPGYVMGTYEGDGARSRAVDLAFAPAWGLVFQAGGPPVQANFTFNDTYANLAFFSQAGCSLGVELTATGFAVDHTPEDNVSWPVSKLNAAGKTYVYIAYKK